MPRASFKVPDDLTKELSDVTIRIYKTALNHLAKEGYETRDDLKKHQKEVVKFIEETYAPGSGDKEKQKRRVMYSAIFWILHELPLSVKQKYYDAFQTSKHMAATSLITNTK